MKEIIGAIAVILTFVGYIPYIRDTIKGKTTPHVYTWFIWGLVTAMIFALQMSDKAGPGAFATLAAAIVCFIVFGCGMRNGKKDITVSDTIFFILSLVALVLWLFVKQPVISVALVTIVDLFAFVPTIRKSWHKPHEETLISYIANTVRFCLATYALQRYTFVTAIYPALMILGNGLFSIFLIVRRAAVGGAAHKKY